MFTSIRLEAQEPSYTQLHTLVQKLSTPVTETSKEFRSYNTAERSLHCAARKTLVFHEASLVNRMITTGEIPGQAECEGVTLGNDVEPSGWSLRLA